MKRISITLDDELEAALQEFINTQEIKPTLTAVIQTAVHQFLRSKSAQRQEGTVGSRSNDKAPR